MEMRWRGDVDIGGEAAIHGPRGNMGPRRRRRRQAVDRRYGSIAGWREMGGNGQKWARMGVETRRRKVKPGKDTVAQYELYQTQQSEADVMQKRGKINSKLNM